MTSPNDPRRRQIVVAGVQANVGTSVVVGGLRGQGYNAVDAGVYSGGRVDVLVAGAAMSNVAPAQRAIQLAGQPPVLAIVADTDRSLPSSIRQAWWMVRGDTRGNIPVPFVSAWRAQKDPPAQAEAAARDPKANRDIKGFLRATKEIGDLGKRLAHELGPAQTLERRQAAQQATPQFATVPSAPFQPPTQAAANWQQLLPVAAEIVESLKTPPPAVQVAAASAALGTTASLLDYAKPINFGHLSSSQFGNQVQQTASAKGIHSHASHQGVKRNVFGPVRVR